MSTVAQNLATTIARWLSREGEITSDQAASIPTIAATCGMLHDLGNPPFGHAGERAISDWFHLQLNEDAEFTGGFKAMGSAGIDSQYAQDFLRFDGNPQTLRLVSKLQMVSDPYGLNLTCATLSAACKYVAASDSTDQAKPIRKKPGYFASENDLVAKIRERTGTGDARNPIAFLVEVADDLVYSTVDLEDGVKKGMLTWDEYEAGLRDQVRDSKDLLDEALRQTKKKVDSGPLLVPRGERDEAMAQVFRTFAMATLVPDVIQTFQRVYPRIMDGTLADDIIGISRAASLVEACKSLAQKYIYPNEEILRLEVMGRQIIHDLMSLFWFGAKEYKVDDKVKAFQMKLFRLMSKNYRNVFKDAIEKSNARSSASLPAMYCRLQLVTDHICGMTDSFARTLHRQLKNG